MRPFAFAAVVAGLSSAPPLVPAQTASDPRAFASSEPAAAARPLAFGRLLVQLEVVPACVFDTGSGRTPIRCTHGVPFRSAVVNDADAAFAKTQAFGPPRAASSELVRIEAQRLDVEF